MIRLHVALGLPDPAGEPELPAALLEGARAFLRSGGVLSLSEWSIQAPIEREALERAATELARAANGFALRGPDDAEPPPPESERVLLERARRLAVKRELMEALAARGFSFPDGVASLHEHLVRLNLSPLVRHLMRGEVPLAEGVERFERTWRADEAADQPAHAS